MDGIDSTPHKVKAANSDPYGPEVLCASWNPVVAALAGPAEGRPTLLTEAAAADAETFLPRFYRAQQA